MAVTKKKAKPVETDDPVADKQKALSTALGQIEKNYGKGAIMKLGEGLDVDVDAISTGSISLDLALGVGGVPRGRIVEIYGPESSGKTTVALHCVAEAQKLAETAGIETHTGAKGFRNTPVWAEHLLTDTEKTTVFTGNAKQAIATFPRRVNVAVATSLATTGPEITGVTMHSVPGWVGDDHCITAEIEGVKAVVDICSSTSAIAGWSAVSLLRNLASPVCFY